MQIPRRGTLHIDVKVLQETPDLFCASIKNVMVAIWRHTPSVAAYEDAFPRVKSLFEQYEHTAIIKNTIFVDAPAGDEGYDAIEAAKETLIQFKPSLKAIAIVNPAKTAVQKLSALSFHTPSWQTGVRSKIFETTTKATEWICSELANYSACLISLDKLNEALETIDKYNDDYLASLSDKI